jgi:hypothetical protein
LYRHSRGDIARQSVVEDYQIDILLGQIDVTMSQYRYLQIFFENGEAGLSTPSEPARPRVEREYYSEPICAAGCCDPEGTFVKAAEALTMFYQEHETDHPEID